MIEAKEKKLPIFAARFSELRGERTQADFAEFLGISRPTVGFYENGERIPDALVLKQISEKCGVTTDYLVGLSNNKTQETASIGDITGLSDKSIEVLKCLKRNVNSKKWAWGPIVLAVINILLENEDTALIQEKVEYMRTHKIENWLDKIDEFTQGGTPGQNICSLLATYLASKPKKITHYIDLYGNVYDSRKDSTDGIPIYPATGERLIESVTLDTAIEAIRKIKEEFSFELPPDPKQIRFYKMTQEQIRELYSGGDDNADNPEAR